VVNSVVSIPMSYANFKMARPTTVIYLLRII